MLSCRVVGLFLAVLATIDAGASREVDDAKLRENVGKWQQLQRMVNAELKRTQPDTFVNPFNDTGFLSIDKTDGSAVVLSAKNIVPDLDTMALLFDTARNSSTIDLCSTYFPPPDGYERDAVPLITVAVMTNVTYPRRKGRPDKYLPYLCALKRQTALMIFLDISGSLAYPPLGDVCSSMQLIRQALHSPRFLVTLFRESTMKKKSGLCRPIVWGNLSPYLQIRRDIEHEAKETLLFLGSNGGSINFGINDKVHWLGPYSKRHALMMKDPQFAKERQKLLSHLYVVFDNTCQLAFRARRLGENKMTGPRFSVPNVDHMKQRWQAKRKELAEYIESLGEDFTTIPILMIIPVLLFAGTVVMFIAVNPQYVNNNYERIIEVVEDENAQVKTVDKAEKKIGVLDTIKNIVSDPMNISHGKRIKKKRSTDKTSDQTTTVAEVTAEADTTMTGRANATKKDDKKKKSASGGKGGAASAKKKNMKKQEKTTMTSDNETTAEGTMGTTAATEVTAGALTVPGSNLKLEK